jgi:3-oxoadipate CoA-transferase, beta subunit
MSHGWSREQMAANAAQDIPDGSFVNLGIGIPELVANFVPDGREFIYHSENGLLGMGPTPASGDIDLDLVNAGKKPVSFAPGASLFHHADSFAMIRGGHIDYCILGAMQVAENGDLANWSTGGEGAVPAVGGAMDLVAGVRTIFVISQHTTKNGTPKLVRSCSYPLTGQGVVSRIYTDLAVIAVTPPGFQVVKIAPGVSFDELCEKSGAHLLPAN